MSARAKDILALIMHFYHLIKNIIVYLPCKRKYLQTY